MSRPVSISSGPSLVGSFVNGVQNAAARNHRASADALPEDAAGGGEGATPAVTTGSTRFKTFYAGMQARIHSYRDKLEADSSSVTYYSMTVVKQGVAFDVEKRYSEFFAFQEAMKEQVVGGLTNPFPPKVAGFKSAVKAVMGQAKMNELRKNMLNAWVAELLTKPLTASAKAQLDAFFETYSHVPPCKPTSPAFCCASEAAVSQRAPARQPSTNNPPSFPAVRLATTPTTNPRYLLSGALSACRQTAKPPEQTTRSGRPCDERSPAAFAWRAT